LIAQRGAHKKRKEKYARRKGIRKKGGGAGKHRT
jgi:hypothetical protein